MSAAWTDETKARLRKTTFADDFRADVDTAIARIEELERQVVGWTAMAGEQRHRSEELEREVERLKDNRSELNAAEVDRLLSRAESAEREVERLKGAKDDAERSRDDAIGRCVEAQREVERLNHEWTTTGKHLLERAEAAEVEVERLKAFVKQKEEARASAAGALSREMGRANAAEANAAALQDVVDGALKNEQKERNRAITAEGKLAEAQRHILADEERGKLTGDALHAEGLLAAEREAHERTRERVSKLRQWLGVVLDAVDYTAGACSMREMVGAVLHVDIINRSRAALRDTRVEPVRSIIDALAWRDESEEPMLDSPDHRPKELDDFAARDYERQNRWKP